MYLRAAILNAKGVEITSARFLNPDPVARSLKLASSVVVTTTPEEGKKMGSNIFLLSRKREIKTAHSANKTTRCRNCQRYGHTAPVCKYDHPVCSICALHHRKTEHRCPNPTCPKEGNLRPVANCCSASPAHCANCGIITLPLTLPAQLDLAVPPLTRYLLHRAKSTLPLLKGTWIQLKMRVRPLPRPPDPPLRRLSEDFSRPLR